MQITTIEQLQVMKKTQIIELPNFDDGTPFRCEVKRPNMMQLISSGKIPNSLLNMAMDLFNKGGTNTMQKVDNDVKTFKELVSMLDIIADHTLVRPTYKDLKESEIELNENQLMGLLVFSQNGVKALETFRKKQTDNQDIESIKEI